MEIDDSDTVIEAELEAETLRNELAEFDKWRGGGAPPFRELINDIQPISRVHMSLFERTLPHSLDAERALLSIILRDNGIMGHVDVSHLQPTDFFRDAHRRIFTCMGRLRKKGKSIEFTTLIVELERNGELDEVGGRPYLEVLPTFLAVEKSVSEYVGIIRDKKNLREFIFCLNRQIADCYAAELPARELYGLILQSVWNLGQQFMK